MSVINTYRIRLRWNSFIIKFVFYIYYVYNTLIYATRDDELLNIEPKTNIRIVYTNLFYFLAAPALHCDYI